MSFRILSSAREFAREEAELMSSLDGVDRASIAGELEVLKQLGDTYAAQGLCGSDANSSVQVRLSTSHSLLPPSLPKLIPLSPSLVDFFPPPSLPFPSLDIRNHLCFPSSLGTKINPPNFFGRT